jgi:hypothetical protein
MSHLIYKNPVSVLLLIFFTCYILFFSPDCSAQILNKVMGPIGGSGGSIPDQTQNTKSDNSTLIIIGAAVIAGFLVYTLVLDKAKPKNTEKTDSTSKQSLLENWINNSKNSTAMELNELQQLPLNLYIGVQNQDVCIPERKVIMGISCNF